MKKAKLQGEMMRKRGRATVMRVRAVKNNRGTSIKNVMRVAVKNPRKPKTAGGYQAQFEQRQRAKNPSWRFGMNPVKGTKRKGIPGRKGRKAPSPKRSR